MNTFEQDPVRKHQLEMSLELRVFDALFMEYGVKKYELKCGIACTPGILKIVDQ